MTTRDNCDNEWQKNNSEWYNEWERMRASKKRVILSFKMKQKTKIPLEYFHFIFYAIYNYYLLSNIENL